MAMVFSHVEGEWFLMNKLHWQYMQLVQEYGYLTAQIRKYVCVCMDACM